MSDTQFKHCSICKKAIPFGGDYYRCSVSTCNQKRTQLFFCSVTCWDAHVPGARHRDAWAEPARAPTLQQHQASSATRTPVPGPAPAVQRRQVRAQGEDEVELTQDVLVVVSKLKKYIRARAGMNTSDGVTRVLSDHLRQLSRAAIEHARQDERRTVLDRDFHAVLNKRDDR